MVSNLGSTIGPQFLLSIDVGEVDMYRRGSLQAAIKYCLRHSGPFPGLRYTARRVRLLMPACADAQRKILSEALRMIFRFISRTSPERRRAGRPAAAQAGPCWPASETRMTSQSRPFHLTRQPSPSGGPRAGRGRRGVTGRRLCCTGNALARREATGPLQQSPAAVPASPALTHTRAGPGLGPRRPVWNHFQHF